MIPDGTDEMIYTDYITLSNAKIEKEILDMKNKPK